jgi:hypothetical protein
MMLLGFVFLSLNLEHFVELFITGLFLFWERAAVRRLVLKNLIAHRNRNRKTTIMYAVSLAFIIFVSVVFSLEIQTLYYGEQQSNGALIRIYGNGVNPGMHAQHPQHPLRMCACVCARCFSQSTATGQANGIEPELRLLIEAYCDNRTDLIESYGFAVTPLSGLNWTSVCGISNVGRVFEYSQSVFGVSPGFFSATLDGFLKTTEFLNPSVGADGLLDFLYSSDGSATMVIGDLYRSPQTLYLEQEKYMLFDFVRRLTPNETNALISFSNGERTLRL